MRDAGQTPLHLAAQQGNRATVYTLLMSSSYSALDADANNWLPLHEAIRTGSIEVVLLLLMEGEKGGERKQLSAKMNNGGNALWLANDLFPTTNTSPLHEIVQLLLDFGAHEEGPAHRTNIRGGDGLYANEHDVPLCMLCSKGLQIVEATGNTTLFRAPRPSCAVFCSTCKHQPLLQQQTLFVICGQCFNDRNHNHDPAHIFALVGSDEGGEWNGKKRGRGPPPPHPSSNRRGPWG